MIAQHDEIHLEDYLNENVQYFDFKLDETRILTN